MMKLNRTVVLPRFGGSEVLEVGTREVPQPAENEVLVHVAAASLNPVDWKLRAGLFQSFLPAESLPAWLGGDLAGTVEAVGPGIDGRFRIGERVFAMLGGAGGAQSDYVLVDAGLLAAAPKAIDMVQAAAVPLAGLTAWQGLFDHGGLREGQRVLIHGGAGGVGHFAIQFAKAAGATVFTTCSAGDLEFVREIGADVAIDYRQERFEDVAQDIDVVLDLIGGETQDRSWAVLREGGIIVCTLGGADERKAAAANARSAPPFLTQPSGSQLAEIAELIDSDKVRVVVAETFPIEDVRRAHDRLEQGRIRGKLVLTLG
ncbi:NADP-dependent oxidoreductase [Pseudochelatococcus sp. B33]